MIKQINGHIKPFKPFKFLMATARAETREINYSNSEFAVLKREQKKYYKLYWEENYKLPKEERLTDDEMRKFARSRIFNELLMNVKITPFDVIYNEIKNGKSSSVESYAVKSLSLTDDQNDDDLIYSWEDTIGSIYNFNLNDMNEDEFIKLFRRKSDSTQKERISSIYKRIKQGEKIWKKKIHDFNIDYVELDKNLEKKIHEFNINHTEVEKVPPGIKISGKKPKTTIESK